MAEKEPVKLSESYVSMALGAIVVLVIGILIFNYFSKINKSKTAQPGETQQATAQKSPTPSEAPKKVAEKPAALSPTSSEETYTVVKGDNLWKISEKFYGSGYNWKLIASENKLVNPRLIHSGNVFRIPKSAVASLPQAGITTTKGGFPVSPVSITGGTYTVARGDTLWGIAVRAYADGFQWGKIAKANNIANPRALRVGTTLNIPR